MADFFITFRETLEASLVIGIVVSYLLRTEQRRYLRYVWWGGMVGLTLSLGVGVVLFYVSGGFEGAAEEIFEGVTMIFAAGLLATMLVWMKRQRGHTKKIEEKVERHIERKRLVGIFFLIFLSVLREGIETAIFLLAATSFAQANSIGGALLGIAGAVLLVVVLFTAWKKVSLKTFFTISTVVLGLFAVGLLAHGVHELQEASVLPVFAQQAYDVNHIVSESGIAGSILKSLFGYNGNPSLLEVIVYLGGLVVLLNFLWPRTLATKKVS
ncbi:MAG: hypothetical protein A2898_02370 [Candidatus Kerfeldbacteria bacterium RIFCSPLOWO2_01_FULL_48_11]|uniref:High-affinity iron transporter n=1 Tax=Candidatus Kerfeldbacteria bacterium RIFCSPLOWO2_01_FULL_48_11 TaxID=1798543 RepID=A0A1G2B1V6_9BACT|nr:MAG: High-affinity iron transporter [Parcubacteria group bacterium GW2011_GWA2_48_9]OGY83162.1 MAG: hypothetical protein A2898_02370 [Candidatus Kerfeldbacteria bacterium RIFCSPLOWO2_01_FULL_48_11]